MNKKVKKSIEYTLSIAIAAALIYVSFKGNDWNDFFVALKGTDWWYILLSMLAAVVALVFRAERWRNQILPIDPDVTRSSVWHGSNIGNFLSIVFPGVGEFYRCGHVSTRKASFDKTFGTILMERAWDIFAIVALILVAIIGNSGVIVPFMRDNVLIPFAARFKFSLWIAVGAAAIVLASVFVLIFALRRRVPAFDRIAGWIRGIVGGFAAFLKMKHKGLFMLYTAGIWISYIFMTYFTFLAVPGLDHLHFADAVFISAVGNIASVIPTPGNIGPYHYLVGLAISTIYLQAEGMTALGLLCATLSHGSHAILLILLGIESYMHVSILKKRRNETPDSEELL